jgi:hypothetical protein
MLSCTRDWASPICTGRSNARAMRRSSAASRSPSSRREHRDELVAAVARHRAVVADATGQPLRDLAQQAVARAVAEAVVDVLEPVHVHEQQRERALLRHRLSISSRSVARFGKPVSASRAPASPVDRSESISSVRSLITQM